LDENDEIAAITKLDKLEEETNGHAPVEPTAEAGNDAANGAATDAAGTAGANDTAGAAGPTDAASGDGEQETGNDTLPDGPAA
jgi:hypothetical protein